MKKLIIAKRPSSLLILTVFLMFSVSCKEALDIGPSKVSLDDKNVYTTDGGAQSVLAGLYTTMGDANGTYNGPSGVSMLLGLGSDELVNANPSSLANATAYTNNYTANFVPNYWSSLYRHIFVCNLALKGIAESSQVSAGVKKQLLGELAFIRAFSYFNLINLYGDVPLTTTDDYQSNRSIARTNQAQVYQRIIADLLDAQSNLPDSKYVDAFGAASVDRIRPNKQVATALLARVYLYQQDYKNAEIQASQTIANSNYLLEKNLNQVFLRTSKEAIWQLQPTAISSPNTADANILIINNNSFATSGILPLSNSLMQSFENGDLRLTNWVGQYRTTTTPATLYNFAFKYKAFGVNSATPQTEFVMLFRLAEQYLIRAEARARQDNLSAAMEDVNAIRSRAGLTNLLATDQPTTLAIIEKERRIELFTEAGHRWLDLKRTNRLNTLMPSITASKGGTWAAYKQLFPIPPNDILANPALTQTPGY